MQALNRIVFAAPVLVGLWALVPSQLARAAEVTAKGEVIVILAKEAEGEFDPKLKKLPALRQPPFNTYKSMTVLSTHTIELATDKDATVELPNGSTLKLKVLERLADGRHRVQASVSPKGKQGTQLIMLASSEPFFIAGQSHDGGKLVIGVTVSGGAKK